MKQFDVGKAKMNYSLLKISTRLRLKARSSAMSVLCFSLPQIAKRLLEEKQNRIFLTARNELFLGTKIKPFL